MKAAHADKTITRVKLLEEYLDNEKSNLLSFSTDYLMNKPKEGYSKQYFETAEKINILQDMVSEYKNRE